MELALHQGFRISVPALPHGMCNPEHITSRSLVSFTNKIERIIHSGPSYQIYVRTLRNINSSEVSKASN